MCSKVGSDFFSFFSWRICFCYIFPSNCPFKINHTTIHSFTHSSPSSITFLKYPFHISLFCKLFQSRSGIQNNVKITLQWGQAAPCMLRPINCSMLQNHCTPENYFLVLHPLSFCLSSQHFSQTWLVISLLMYWNLRKHH